MGHVSNVVVRGRVVAVLSLFLLGSADARAQGVTPPFDAALVVGGTEAHFRGALDYDGDGATDFMSAWFDSPVTLIRVKGFRNVAGRFVEDAPSAHWDAVLVDLFGAYEASPLVASPAFLAGVRRVLRPGGAVAMNLVGSLDGSSGALPAAEAALDEAFRGARITLPILDEDEARSGFASLSSPRNVVAFATMGCPTAACSPSATSSTRSSVMDCPASA